MSKNAGFSETTTFLATKEIPDEDILKIVNACCKLLNVSLQQFADMLGDYWVNEYAFKMFKFYYSKPKSAKEFILNMDTVHQNVTKTFPESNPPRFDYEWKDDKTLLMAYKSKRGLMDFLVGLIKGVGKHFNENLRVTKIGSNKVQIVFPN